MSASDAVSRATLEGLTPLGPEGGAKRCSKCDTWYEDAAAGFSRNRTTRDGYNHHCKQCCKRASKARRERDAGTVRLYPDGKTCSRCGVHYPDAEANFWRNAPYLVSYCKQCGSKDERAIQEKRRWYERNREQELERVRERYVANREHHLALARAWHQANREKRREYQLRRRARKRRAPGRTTAADIRRQYERQRGRCYWCETELGGAYEVDHVVPLSRGGSNGPENIVIACRHCNRSKSDKLPEEWEGARIRLQELPRSA